MSIELMPSSRQEPGQFNGGEILERRPVIFDHPGGFHSYSNLFYWAHAWSDQGSTIGLHPHKGFEILSYVINGSIEHYDTLLRQWIPLNEGAAQIIRSGSGISHSEKINPGSHMFQIWFDPGLRKAIGKPASYNDYAQDEFPRSGNAQLMRRIYIGEGSPLQLESPARMEQIDFAAGSFEQAIPEGWVLSWFQISGESLLGGSKVTAGDFARVLDETKVKCESPEGGSAFLIFTPVDPGYETYA